MKFIKYIMLLLITVPLCAQSPATEPVAQKKPAGFWAYIASMFSSDNAELRRRRAKIAAFKDELKWTRNLIDIKNQIKTCEHDKKCSAILSSKEVKQAIEDRRKDFINLLNKSVNDILTDHGVHMYFDFNKGINATDENGNTALHWSMMLGIPAIVTRWLIENGANINAYNSVKITPLMLAIEGLRLDLISILLQNGADKNLTDKNGNNALERARNTIEQSKVDQNVAHAMISILQSSRPRVYKIEKRPEWDASSIANTSE